MKLFEIKSKENLKQKFRRSKREKKGNILVQTLEQNFTRNIYWQHFYFFLSNVSGFFLSDCRNITTTHPTKFWKKFQHTYSNIEILYEKFLSSWQKVGPKELVKKMYIKTVKRVWCTSWHKSQMAKWKVHVKGCTSKSLRELIIKVIMK